MKFKVFSYCFSVIENRLQNVLSCRTKLCYLDCYTTALQIFLLCLISFLPHSPTFHHFFYFLLFLHLPIFSVSTFLNKFLTSDLSLAEPTPLSEVSNYSAKKQELNGVSPVFPESSFLHSDLAQQAVLLQEQLQQPLYSPFYKFALSLAFLSFSFF